MYLQDSRSNYKNNKNNIDAKNNQEYYSAVIDFECISINAVDTLVDPDFKNVRQLPNLSKIKINTCIVRLE